VEVFNTTGDDVNSEVKYAFTAINFIDRANYIGLSVNPKKVFVSPVATDYLRKFAVRTDKLSVNGFFVRGTSELFGAPGSTPIPRGASRAQAILANWVRRLSRAACFGWVDKAKWREGLVDDLAGAMDLSKSVMDRWISTPASLGGGGFEVDWSRENFGVSIVDDVIEEEWGVRGLKYDGQGNVGDIARKVLAPRGVSKTRFSVRRVSWGYEAPWSLNRGNRLSIAMVLERRWERAQLEEVVRDTRTRDLDEVVEKFATVKSRGDWSHVRKGRGTLRRDWILGRVKVASAPVLLRDPLQLSEHWTELQEFAFWAIMHRRSSYMREEYEKWVGLRIERELCKVAERLDFYLSR
jgi:hypothetical protein